MLLTQVVWMCEEYHSILSTPTESTFVADTDILVKPKYQLIYRLISSIRYCVDLWKHVITFRKQESTIAFTGR